jgi:protein-tyrosine phosphatase
MAEVMLRHRLEERGITATVASAGLYPSGSPATDDARGTMADRGLDLDRHVSRRIDAELIADADLIIGMTREHVREIAVVDTDALHRTFTLKELVRAGTAMGPRHADQSVSAWLRRAGQGRRREALLGVGHDDAYDIDDPVGRPRADYEAAADEIDGLLARLVALLWPEAADEQQERTA